jgi:hypothetical protein
VLLAAGLCVISGGTLLARQDPPAQQKPADPPDMFKFTSNSPVLIISQVKPAKVADFEAAWAAIREAFSKADRPEAKEFGATLEKFYKVELPPGAPPIYIHQIDSPSTAFSYHPGKIIYEVLYYQKDNKEMGLPRAQADEIWTKLKDCYDNLNPWPLKKAGS